MPQWKTASTRGAKRRDRLARWIITLGGVTVIASVVAILALIVGVALPLFRSPQASVIAKCHFDGEATVLAIGVDADMDGRRLTGILWRENGTLAWIDLRTGRTLGQKRLLAPGRDAAGPLRSVEPLGGGRYALDWSNGAAALVEVVRSAAVIKHTNQNSDYSVRTLAEIEPKSAAAEKCFLRRSDAGAITYVVLQPDRTILVLRRATLETLLGDREIFDRQSLLRDDIVAHLRAITLDREGNTIYGGTDDGRLVRWQLDERGEVVQREVVRAFADGRSITALAMVLGDVSLAVGDAKGGLTTWSPVNADGTRKLRMIHALQPHRSAVETIVPSGRTKSLFSLGRDGAIHLDHMTSERHLLTLLPGPDRPFRQIALGARGDAALAVDASGGLTAWHIEGGCPEISLRTLFGKVFYEGYAQPEYVWQTTGGEEFEPKFSLVPLLFGTMKGTLYAMFFAAPLALFGAVYVSYFTTPGFRKMIKPGVEVMATVPSVVIGFLVALWLAPILERWIFAFFLSLMTVPTAFVAFMVLWQYVRRFDAARRVETGYEFLAILPVLLVGIAAAARLAPPLEMWLFGGNVRRWLFEGPLAMQYDQRNSIIIAFGLGFTVIPIIFSIAEDALSNVPYSMTAASMAVGASRWQTLWRVVLPSASPGIFAAMMIGFGRAVGETMIVLMATGNTPILDWSPLNGMRTLSANVAVEIPEAPVGGTLYRVLFLCAVLLFLLTFTVNTAAELVRQRLRKRFGRF